MTTDIRSFGVHLRDLLLEKGVTTRIGNPDWAGFAQLLEASRRDASQGRDRGALPRTKGDRGSEPRLECRTDRVR